MKQVNPITLEVVRGSLVSTVLQMRATLVRTAYAPILYETRDFSCGMLTPDSELAAMSEDFSGHVFAMNLGLKAVLEKFKDDVHPGDVLAVNDPYTGGTHMNDIAFYSPFFSEGRLPLFIAVRAHFADVGGATPGSFSGQDTEIYQEGMRIIPVKLIEKGKLNQGLWDVLFANMRLREEREGDALAMLDTARVAGMGLTEVCNRYGTETVEDSVNALLDSAEATMRERISGLPDGEYHYEQYMDNGGLSPDPLPIKLRLAIEGDKMTFDFTGTAPQVHGPMNCGIPVTMGGAFVVVKSWLDPKTPVNGGTFRPLDFVIPEGSCLAARLPAAVGGCWDVYRQLQAVVTGAFSQVIPHDLGGENIGAANHCYLAGYDELRNKPYILYEYPQGGTPATSDTDGATGCYICDGGDIASAYPAESTEQRQPLLIESLSARADGEGPGFRRSGWGVTRRLRVLSDTSQLNVMTDRAIIPTWGSGGAPAGSCNSFFVVRDGEEIQPSEIPGKVKAFPLKAGDVVVMQSTSGGGVGDPLEREPDRVLRDVIEGYLSPERARGLYGVAIDDGSVNEAETGQLRDEIRSRRYYAIIADGADETDERGCRVCRIDAETASSLGVGDGDMVELLSRTTAPLRAWVTVTDGLSEHQVPVGPVGRSIIKVEVGDRVWIRALATTPVGAAAGTRP